MEKLSIEIVDWRPCERGTLQGFCNIRIAELRLHVADVTVHEHENGKRWCGLPAKPQIDRDRKLVIGSDGKVTYAKILWFDSRKVGDAFSAAVLAALDRHLARGRAA